MLLFDVWLGIRQFEDMFDGTGSRAIQTHVSMIPSLALPRVRIGRIRKRRNSGNFMVSLVGLQNLSYQNPTYLSREQTLIMAKFLWIVSFLCRFLQLYV